MLGIVMLFWIGKYYYQLAIEFNKSKWGFAILGLVTYYGTMFVFAMIFAILNELFAFGFDLEKDEMLLSIACIPFGLLGTYGLYKFLEKKWKSEYVNPMSEIETIGVTNE